jgi:hypothetical protein
MNKLKHAVALISGTLLFFVPGYGWTPPAESSGLGSHQASAAQSFVGHHSSSSSKKSSTKTKAWHGKLVDANCIAQAMAKTAPSVPQGASPGIPHFVSDSGAQGQYPGGAGQQQQMPGGQPGQSPTSQQPNGPGVPNSPNPGMGPGESPQAQRAAMVDKAAKQCAATTSTAAFGLVEADGRIIRFGTNGNNQASEAVKQVQLKPGKAVKATVKGTEQSGGSLEVTSVEVKGKHAK